MKSTLIIPMLIILTHMVSHRSAGQSSNNENTGTGLGVSQMNITPDVPVIMSGYDARKTPSTGIHDSLYASALFFLNEKTKLLIITTDLIGFTSAFADEVKKMIAAKIDMPSENIMLSAVHNHGGPAVKTYEDELPGSNEIYIKLLKEKLGSLAAEASKNPKPFRMGIGKGECRMNINRRAEFADGGIWLGRNPDGVCDHELVMVKFEDLDHHTLAYLVNWPCHGTASGQENYLITGDWPGVAARYIKKIAGRDVIVAITAGASADINPVYGPGSDFGEIEAVGYQVGKEAWNSLTGIETFPVKSIHAIHSAMTFPGKKECKDQFPMTKYETGPEVEVRLTIMKIGDLVLSGISGELMTEIGMEIKQQSPFTNTLIITHCNGSSGYICTDQSFSEGGYEVKVTRMMPGVEKRLVQKVLDLIYSF
jgi:neutral ceramidase